MTREEAIEYLKCADVTVGRERKTKTAEVLEMAIKALEQEPCEDCVSRKAVLDINEHHHGQMPNHVNHEIWKEIKALPPVNPQEPKITTYYTNEKGQKVQIEYDIYDTARISRDLLEIYLEEHGFRKCGE